MNRFEKIFISFVLLGILLLIYYIFLIPIFDSEKETNPKLNNFLTFSILDKVSGALENNEYIKNAEAYLNTFKPNNNEIDVNQSTSSDIQSISIIPKQNEITQTGTSLDETSSGSIISETGSDITTSGTTIEESRTSSGYSIWETLANKFVDLFD